MANQFKTIISHFNGLSESHIFTSRDMKNDLAETVNPTAVTSFLNLAFKLGAIDKDKIEKPKKGGPRLNYMKCRSLTDGEIKGLTVYPDCIEFKKKIEANYKEISSAETVEKSITVKTHKRKIPVRISKGEKITISDYKDRLVLTIYKK